MSWFADFSAGATLRAPHCCRNRSTPNRVELWRSILEISETQEQIEHAQQKHNKRAAIMIIVLAALLAISEMAGKHAQTASIAHNIEANDLWAFYQARTIRSTILRTASELAELLPVDAAPDRMGPRKARGAAGEKPPNRS